MSLFRKKPVVIAAVQWDGTNYREVYEGLGVPEDVLFRGEFGDLFIPTPEGDMRASRGDWIIRGVKGEFYPCKPDIFEATYDPIEGDAR